MARLVRKYGGSSLSDEKKIAAIAKSIADRKWLGDEVVVVVSAMASTTDELVEMAHKLHSDPPRREMDMLLSVGERISCALLALAIEAEGINAVSYTGSQVGIITDTRHGEARIVDIRPTRLLQALEKNQVVVVAGFQGVSIDKEITTLGRGGSDATAVALAAAIHADRCELMKDVDGLYTAHPGVVEEANVIEAVDYDNAINLSRGGTAALQSEAVRIAKEKNVDLAIGNSETGIIGTIITDRPFDCGEIVGLARKDGISLSQGINPAPECTTRVKMVENHGRWMQWDHPEDSCKDSEYSAITVVTSGRYIPNLHKTIQTLLTGASIQTYGCMESLSDYWVCVKGVDADKALSLLHNTFVEHGWIRCSSS